MTSSYRLGIFWALGLVAILLTGCADVPVENTTNVQAEQVVHEQPSGEKEEVQATPEQATGPAFAALEFHTYSSDWIRYKNIDEGGNVKVGSEGMTSFPYIYLVSESPVVLNDLDNGETLQGLVGEYDLLSNVENADGLCDTTTLTGLSTDLFCRLGSEAPQEHFYLVIYSSETLEALAVTTTINNLNNAVAGEAISTSESKNRSGPAVPPTDAISDTPSPAIAPTSSSSVPPTATPAQRSSSGRSNPPAATPQPTAASQQPPAATPRPTAASQQPPMATPQPTATPQQPPTATPRPTDEPPRENPTPTSKPPVKQPTPTSIPPVVQPTPTSIPPKDEEPPCDSPLGCDGDNIHE